MKIKGAVGTLKQVIIEAMVVTVILWIAIAVFLYYNPSKYQREERNYCNRMYDLGEYKDKYECHQRMRVIGW